MEKLKSQITVKDTLITIGILGATSVAVYLLQQFVSSNSDSHVPLLFVLAVLFISRFTDGYIYGLVASMVAVVGVNYVFTYPYFEFNFTITGYPLTFLSMLAVSISVGTLTTQIKQQEQIKLEVASGILDNHEILTEEKKMELVQDIKDEAQWLIRIVENLLSVTRIHGDNTQIKTEEEVVEEIISSAVIKFAKRFPDVKIDVEMPQEFLMVPMDGILIEQVLVNLLENSVLHGKTTKLIRIVVIHEPGKLLVAVEDDGQGIKPEVLPEMFEGKIHSEEDGEEYDAKRNMGIGLSVCKSIITAHKGGVKAENMSAGGARVMFWLPMEEDETDGD